MYARLIKYLSLALIVCLTACGVIVQWPGSTRSDASAPTLVDLGVKPKDGLPFGMPTNIVPNAIPSLITTLPIPNDGELANSASLSQFVTPLADDVEGYRLLTYGGGFRRKVVGQNATTMTIYPLGAVVISVGGTWKVYAHTVSSLVDPTAMAGGALANSTRYYVYAYDNVGVLSFTASTTAPDVGLRYMSGNASYWFVTTFSTDSGGGFVSYEQTDNEYTLSTSQPILNAGSSLVVAPVVAGVFYPPQATRVYYTAWINTTAAGRYADIFEGGAIRSRLKDDGVSVTYNQGFLNVTAAGGTFSYQVSNAAVQLTIEPLGFRM